MADYKKMYIILCDAIDNVSDALESIPSARHISEALTSAQLKAEEVYIQTCSRLEQTDDPKIIRLNPGK